MSDYNIDKLAEILHTLGCQMPHAQSPEELLKREENKDKCYWYTEQIFKPEDQKDRNKWRSLAKTLCTKYEMPSQDFLRFIYQYLELRRKLTELSSRYSIKAVEDLAPLLLHGSLPWRVDR